jgi:hypothetical protein
MRWADKQCEEAEQEAAIFGFPRLTSSALAALNISSALNAEPLDFPSANDD